MLKRFFLFFSIVAISLILCGCNSTNDAHIDMDDKQNTESESFIRIVDYEINDTVMEMLSLDNETIKLLDEMYIASKEAAEELSAHQFYTTVYDAAIAFNNRFQDSLSQIKNPTDKERQFVLEVFDGYSMNLLAITAAGYECAAKNISIEKAAFDIFVATDSIFNYMYQDYVPMYQPLAMDVDSIFKMYEANELVAESKLKNQLLCVNGNVYEVARDVMDKPYVGLATSEGKSYELLRCYINSSQSDTITSLKNGDKVSCVIQIIDKDIFDINAKLWDISLENDN